MPQRFHGGVIVDGPGPGDVTIDVTAAPYESGFKFNTLPFGGMTIAEKNAVRLGSAASINLEPAKDNGVVLGTTLSTAGTLPAASSVAPGTIFFVAGTPGVSADTLQVALRPIGGGSPSWKTFATG